VNSVTARVLLLIAGGVFLLQSLVWFFIVLLVAVWPLFDGNPEPISTWDVLFVLCFLLPFSVYLIGLKSLRITTWLLWALFVLQLVSVCFINHDLMIYPFGWWYEDTLFAISIAFVHRGYQILSREWGSGTTIYNAFGMME
jgi:hypothetical protein